MRYLAATTVAVLIVVGWAIGGQAPAARAAAVPVPVPVVPPPGAVMLAQNPAGTWTTDVYLDTAALCGDTFDLATGTPVADEPAAKVTYDGSGAAPCGAASPRAASAETRVEATFPALPGGAIPLTAALVVTPSAAALGAGAEPVDIALTVRRDVSVMQYLWIPLCCGIGLAALLIVLTMLIGVRRPDGQTAHAHQDSFWQMPLYAGSAWTFSDSWVTNITAVGTLIGTLLTATSSVAVLLPGVDPARFGLLLAMAGGFAVIAPVIFGLLNYRFSRLSPQGGAIVAISLPDAGGGGDVTVTMHVGGCITVPGGAALPGGRALNPGATLDVPAGAVVAVSAAEGAKDAKILALPGSNDIVLPPALRITLSPAVRAPFSALQAAEPSLTSRVAALVWPDEWKTATEASPATVASLTVPEGARVSFTGRADIRLPAGSSVAAAGEAAQDPRRVALSDPRTFSLPFSGEVVSQMWSMLLASCFTMFGIGANLGIVGWVIGYDLAAAPLWARGCVAALSGLAALIIVLYGVFAIRALADSREGSVLSGRRGAAFIL